MDKKIITRFKETENKLATVKRSLQELNHISLKLSKIAATLNQLFEQKEIKKYEHYLDNI